MQSTVKPLSVNCRKVVAKTTTYIFFVLCLSVLCVHTALSQEFKQGITEHCVDKEIRSKSSMRRDFRGRVEKRELRRKRPRYVCSTGRYGDYGRGYYCRARFCGYVLNGRPVDGYFSGRGCFGERITCYGNIRNAVCR